MRKHSTHAAAALAAVVVLSFLSGALNAAEIKLSNYSIRPTNNRRFWQIQGEVTAKGFPKGPNASCGIWIGLEHIYEGGKFSALATHDRIGEGFFSGSRKLTDEDIYGVNCRCDQIFAYTLAPAEDGKTLKFEYMPSDRPGAVEYRIHAQLGMLPDKTVEMKDRVTTYEHDLIGPSPWPGDPSLWGASSSGGGGGGTSGNIPWGTKQPLAGSGGGTTQPGGSTNPGTGQTGGTTPIGGGQQGGGIGGATSSGGTTTTNPPPPTVQPPTPPTPPLPPPGTATPKRGYRVIIDGQIMSTSAPPTEVNGRVLVGLADIFRALGASVAWDGPQRKITATRGSRVIQLWIGRTTALVDNQAVQLDVPPMILGGGSTYVPVRFVSQALGAGVNWDASTRSVHISTTGMPPIGSTPTPPFQPPAPPQGTVQVSICRQSGLRATGTCPNTVTQPFAPGSVPGPCTAHAAAGKLFVTEPADGTQVPAIFYVGGTSVPGRKVRCTAVCEATWKATGANATSEVLPETGVEVGADGKWSVRVDTTRARNDSRVRVERFKVTCELRGKGGQTVEQVDLTLTPAP